MKPTVILSKMYDNTMTLLSTEVYPGESNPLDILEFVARCKEVFGHKVISCYDDQHLMFSDGSRVELTMQELQSVEKYQRDDRTRIPSAAD